MALAARCHFEALGDQTGGPVEPSHGLATWRAWLARRRSGSSGHYLTQKKPTEPFRRAGVASGLSRDLPRVRVDLRGKPLAIRGLVAAHYRRTDDRGQDALPDDPDQSEGRGLHDGQR